MGLKFKDILCIKAKRTIANDYTIRWRGRRFLIDNASLVMRRQKVEVREHLDGQISFKFKERYLDCHEVFEARPKREERKITVPMQPHKRYKYIPPLEHPWKKYNYKGKLNPWS